LESQLPPPRSNCRGETVDVPDRVKDYDRAGAIRMNTYRTQYRGYAGDENTDSNGRAAIFAAVNLRIDN